MPRRAAILSAALPALALAACADHRPVERRALNAARRAVDRTTWQGEAKITDPTQECTYYDYAPVNNIVNTYPEIWETATLSSAGIADEPKQLFASINQSIPNIAPRGDREGNFQGVSYGTSRFLHGTTDPDCWWSYTRCDKPKMKGLNADITRCPEPNTWGFTLDDGPNCTHNAYYDYLQTIDQKATLFYMTSMTNEEAFAELYFSKKAIFDILGVTVRCWRPPYGDVDDRIRFIAQALDMRTVVWNEDTDD
ncbi:hypothetical protein Rhopal_004409-T1 [Rhodotorula paludigena]|uniref:chitin deacetylase n=1 Tax=Rhodotorula paludigena TaxID=86838 RepID=A0AAV5GRR4_9BASI|nr:hypothetical protein Rhopal_004409-T1 [Rhodotorula paludigena]